MGGFDLSRVCCLIQDAARLKSGLVEALITGILTLFSLSVITGSYLGMGA